MVAPQHNVAALLTAAMDGTSGALGDDDAFAGGLTTAVPPSGTSVTAAVDQVFASEAVKKLVLDRSS